jgi:hypothetical protein
MAKPDDLQAVRTIASALSGFSPEEQERIIRMGTREIRTSACPTDVGNAHATCATRFAAATYRAC